MAKKLMKSQGEELLSREDGHSSSEGVSNDESHDVGKAGYHRSQLGGVEQENYRIADGYHSKDESPSRKEGTNIHAIALHSVTGQLYSGEPMAHGHKGHAGGADGGGELDESDELS